MNLPTLEVLKIKPCPFCGSFSCIPGWHNHRVWIECDKCGVKGQTVPSSLEKRGDAIFKAAEVWNNRATRSYDSDPEIVGRLCIPSEKMKAVKAYRKVPWVDDAINQHPSDVDMYRIEPLIRLTDHQARMAEFRANAARWEWISKQDWLLNAIDAWACLEFDFKEEFETYIDNEIAKRKELN